MTLHVLWQSPTAIATPGSRRRPGGLYSGASFCVLGVPEILSCVGYVTLFLPVNVGQVHEVNACDYAVRNLFTMVILAPASLRLNAPRLKTRQCVDQIK